MKSKWLYYGLILLSIEKLIQHTFVTFALYYNWGGISSTVAVSPMLLAITGAVVAVLFGVGLWGLTRKKNWSVDLLVGLAVFDIVGEFIAQGRLAIAIPVSFLMAALLLILSILYRRQIHTRALPELP